MIDWLLDKLTATSAWLHGRAHGGQNNVERIERVAVHVPKNSYREATERRVEDSMSLHDPETYGYVLMMLKRPQDSTESEIVVSAVTRLEWNDAFAETARRISEAVSGPVR